MNVEQLHQLYADRVDGETIKQTMERMESQVEKETIDVSYDSDLSIPRIKVIQPSSRVENATVGCFRNMMTEEEYSELDLVFLVQQNSRTLFPDSDFSGVKRCWSFNGYYPASDIEERTGNKPISNQCACKENGKLKFVCPLAEWRNELNQPDPKGRKQPTCKPTISMLAVMKNSLLPCWLTFHGSAIPELKQFLKFVKYKKEEMKRKGLSLKLYDFQVKLGLELVTNTKGKFYVPALKKKVMITDPEEKILLSKCYEELKDRLLSDPLSEAN